MRPWLLIPLLAIPWLNPMVQGPIPAMLQSVVTVLCAIAFVAYAGHTPNAFGKSFAALVAGAWLLAASLSAVAGLIQYFGASASFFPWVSYSAAGEAYGNLRQRNQFATLLNIGMAALLWIQSALAFEWQARRGTVPAKAKAKAKTTLLLRASIPLLAALLAAATAASSSRTGLVQLLLLAGAAVFWWRKGTRSHLPTTHPQAPHLPTPYLLAPHWLMLVALLSYGLASQLLPVLAGHEATIWSRLKPEEVQCTSRMVLWSNVLQIIAQKPWFGWGPGELAFAHFDTLYSGPRFCEILDNAHNLPLQMAVVVGLPATLALGGLLLWGLYRARPWAEQDEDRRLAWQVLALLAVHSLLEYPLWYAPFQLALLLCVLLLCGVRWRQTLLGSGAAQILASAVFALCAYTLWDYWRISQIYLAADQRAPAYQTETLEKIQGSWLFRHQVRFADLGLATVRAENAQPIFDSAKEALHFSPESMVVEKLLDSARLLGRQDAIDYYQVRYRAAYPEAYSRWAQGHAAIAAPQKQ